MYSSRFSFEVLEYLRTALRRNSSGKFWSLQDAVLKFKEQFPEHQLTKTQLRSYETGKSTPRANMVAMLADTFQVEPGVLFTKTPVMDMTEVRDYLCSCGIIDLAG